MQTIIMIHGFRGTHHGLAKIAAQLPDFRIITPDIPGFGEGERLDRYRLDDYVAWLHRFIAALALPEPPLLLGHSFGSIVCAAYAARYPESIAELILVNPIGVPVLAGPRQLTTKLVVGYYWIGSKLPGRVARPWLSARPMVLAMSRFMTRSRDRQLRRWIDHQHLTYFSRFYDAGSLYQIFRTSIEHSVRDYAPLVTVPTLLIAGERDNITPLKHQYELVELFPVASLKVIGNVGHLTHYETPAAVAQLIQSFTKPS